VSDREPEPPPDGAAAPGGELVLAEEGGVRVFYIAAPTMQDLVDRLALVLGEHMRDGDELHVTYNAMQSGWTEHPAKKGHVMRKPEAGWTELHFEYSAFVVLRARDRPPRAPRRRGRVRRPAAGRGRGARPPVCAARRRP
jgi:hypothetical protein